MIIKVNNNTINVLETITVRALLKELNYKEPVAVWINGEQVFLQDYDARLVKQNDSVRLVRIIGGG